MTITDWAKFIRLHLRGDPANPQYQSALLKLDTFAELHAVAPTTTYSKGWVMRGITLLATGDAGPAVIYRAGWFISTSSWAKGTQPGDTGRLLWHGGSDGMSHSVVCIAPEIDFAVLVACNRGPDIAIWKTRHAVKALIRTFAPKRTS
jgi:CubicO group peptidase (beta-lactamase class C family)